MSLVGPRPERQYFINKITEKAPHYIHLLKVTPGVTSWGQVKYGYAENVEDEEMQTRNWIKLWSLEQHLKVVFAQPSVIPLMSRYGPTSPTAADLDRFEGFGVDFRDSPWPTSQEDGYIDVCRNKLSSPKSHAKERQGRHRTLSLNRWSIDKSSTTTETESNSRRPDCRRPDQACMPSTATQHKLSWGVTMEVLYMVWLRWRSTIGELLHVASEGVETWLEFYQNHMAKALKTTTLASRYI